MNIAVMCPQVHGAGETMVSALIASELSHRNKKVCMSHLRSKSDSFFTFFNFIEDSEKGNISQLLSLVKTNSLKKENFPNYCKNISKNLDLFSLNKDLGDDLDISDVHIMLDYLSNESIYDYVVYDMDIHDLEDDTVKYALKNIDCVILVLTQERIVLKRFNDLKNTFIAKTKDIPTVVVINKYLPLYGKVKDVAPLIGVTNNKAIKKWQMLHYNKYITYCANKGDLNRFLEQTHKRTAETIEVNTDVKNIIRQILTVRESNRKNRINKLGNRLSNVD